MYKLIRPLATRFCGFDTYRVYLVFYITGYRYKIVKIARIPNICNCIWCIFCPSLYRIYYRDVFKSIFNDNQIHLLINKNFS